MVNKCHEPPSSWHHGIPETGGCGEGSLQDQPSRRREQLAQDIPGFRA